MNINRNNRKTMFPKVIQAFLSCSIVCIVAFEDVLYVYGQASQEMVEQGRLQYQRLQERGNLPRYGNCWKSALDHLEDGCRDLTEETQSDMALHMTNCFLDMSGHQTYNCELDKKQNLRRICIASMSDRAFGVYTEFYTHSQNICWFLRGQVWHETIAENTLRVGKQLETSAKNQERILKDQRESLALQQKLLEYGRNLEKIMDDFYISTQHHQELLAVMSRSLGNLQSWLVGELSWLDLIIFYTISSILVVIFTSSHRTASARLPILFLLMLNAIFERFIYTFMTLDGLETDLHLVQNDIYSYIWWSRKTFILLSISLLIYKMCMFRDLNKLNNALLQKIYDQNLSISENLERIDQKRFSSVNINNGELSFIRESNSFRENKINDIGLELNSSFKYNNRLENRKSTNNYESSYVNGIIHSTHNKSKDINIYKDELNHKKETDNIVEPSKFNSRLVQSRERISRMGDALTNGSARYNLRNRQNTPDLNL